MFGIGTTELIVVGIVAVILFGGRLPSVARSLGRSLNEFKRGMRDVENDVRDAIYSEPAGHLEDHGKKKAGEDDGKQADQPKTHQEEPDRETADTHGN